MLIANICAADFLRKNYNESVFRNHEYPESIKIDRLSQGLKKEILIGMALPKRLKTFTCLLKMSLAEKM